MSCETTFSPCVTSGAALILYLLTRTELKRGKRKIEAVHPSLLGLDPACFAWSVLRYHQSMVSRVLGARDRGEADAVHFVEGFEREWELARGRFHEKVLGEDHDLILLVAKMHTLALA